jgi:hypothetical protein
MDHIIWNQWASWLYKRRLHEMTATFLEAAGPLTILGTQLVYLSEPVLTLFTPPENTQALAELLENPRNQESFIDLLRAYQPNQGKGGASL